MVANVLVVGRYMAMQRWLIRLEVTTNGCETGRKPVKMAAHYLSVIFNIQRSTG